MWILPCTPLAPPTSVPVAKWIRPVVESENTDDGLTSVISPAPAEINASFTAFVVGIELGSSAIEAETLKNAEVPKTLFQSVLQNH